jgi:N-glycosidase YbiA
MERIDSFEGEYGFLSNFYPCRIYYNGLWYPSVEHAYQAAKTADLDERIRVQSAKTAGKAKRLGKSVTLRPDWEEVKLEIMRLLVYKKFFDYELRKRLCETGAAELVEGNWWGDTYWGVCKGVGENHLGKILMKIRDGGE